MISPLPRPYPFGRVNRKLKKPEFTIHRVANPNTSVILELCLLTANNLCRRRRPMTYSHAEVPSLQRPQCGASFTAEIRLIVDEDKLREAPAAAVPPAVAGVVGTSVQEVNPEPTGRAGAEVVTLEAAMAAAVVGAEKKGGKRRLAPAVMLGLLGASLLASCAPVGTQTVEPGVTIVSTAAATEVQGGVVIVTTEEPTERPEVVEVMATDVPTETPEPTAEPTATPEPEMGMQNEQGQWWDGAGWQSLPEGEGWQVSVEEDGRVTAVDGSGLEHTWENGGWVQERTLASGLEAFANSGVTGQLEMVYSVHPEIVINEEPAKNFYNYFIEVVTTSKGFEPYWQALGLWDHASIMNYLEQNNYRVPTQVGEQFWPTIRFIDESYIINGQESDWVRGDQQLAMVDLSKIGFILTNNDDLGTSGSNQYIDQLYGQGNIGYLGIGFGAALRYAPNGTPIAIIKEVEASLAVNVSLLGRVVDIDYLESLIMHETTLLRALSTTTPKKPEANNCMIPGLTTSASRGACIPDRADGVQNGRVEYHGANIHTLNRLGLVDLFDLKSR